MNKEYVSKYASLETTHWWFVIRQKIISQTIKKYAGKQLKVLNIGAAGGASSNWLGEFGDVISVENDEQFLQYLQSKNIDVRDASAENMPFGDEEFDLVCAFDVIEHIENDRAAIQEILRVCKPGGIICITVPALQMLWGNHDVVNGHFRRYKKQMLNKLFDVQRTSKLQLSYFNFLLFLPILIMRKCQNIFSKKNTIESDFENFKGNGFANAVFRGIFSIEIFLIKIIPFPFGVSLIGFWKKK